MSAEELSKKLDISKNFLVLAIVGLVCGLILILSLVICIALGKLEVQGAKEIMGAVGGVLMTPAAGIGISHLIKGRSNGKAK